MAEIKQYQQKANEPVTNQGAYNPSTPQTRAPVPKLSMQSAATLNNISKTMGQIGTAIQNVQNNQQVADGIAEYNNLINTFNEGLNGVSPSEYMDRFDKLMDGVDSIYDNKSNAAGANLKSTFTVWNEANRAATMMTR